MKYTLSRSWRECLLTLAFLNAILWLPRSTTAQIISDLGQKPPVPGAEDIYQLAKQVTAQRPDGLNYYDDDGVLYPQGAPGQTFYMGTNRTLYTLTTLTIKTAGIDSWLNINIPQNYELRLYSVSGTNALLMTNYTAGPIVFKDGDWLQWVGLAVPLTPDATYAYSFSRTRTVFGWEAMAASYSNPYPAGEITLIPTNGGAMTLGRTHAFDAMFDLGFDPITAPAVSWPICLPSNSVTAGSQVTFKATVLGNPPLSLQWLFDGAPLIGQTNNSLTLSQVGRAQDGVYALMVSNAFGSVISSNVTLTVETMVPPFPLQLTLPSPPLPVQGFITLTFPSIDGASYTIQGNSNLSTFSWTDLTNLLGTGTNVEIQLPASDPNSQFFRVRSP